MVPSLVQRGQRNIWIRDSLFRMNSPYASSDRVSPRMTAKRLCSGWIPRERFLRLRFLDKELTKLGDSVDFAVDVDVPDENIIRKNVRQTCMP